jgi:hypothetical protein
MQLTLRESRFRFCSLFAPPPELTPTDGCQQGVAKVETERSFLNGLVGAITWSIYTPMHVVLTCSSGR